MKIDLSKLKKVKNPGGEVPAAPFMPEDHQPDIIPKPADELTVDEIDFASVSGISETKAGEILKELQSKGIKTYNQAVKFDYTTIAGVGPKTRDNITEFLATLKPFEPEETMAAKKLQLPIAEKSALDKKIDPQTENLTIIMVNCVPLKGLGEAELLSDLLRPLMLEVASDLQVPYWDSKGFAEGGKLLTAKVIKNLDLFRGKKIVAFDNETEIPRVLQVLFGVADIIIKG